MPIDATSAPLSRARVLADLSDARIRRWTATLPTDVRDIQDATALWDELRLALADPDVEAIHVVAHGEPGALRVAGTRVDADAVPHDLVADASRQGRPLALWSCDVGADSALAARLQASTGAEVLAASGPLGHTRHGARWGLSARSGAGCHADQVFGAERAAAFEGTLGWITVSFSGGFVGLNTGTNVASGVSSFADLGWRNVQFAQNAPGTIFTSQGNDIIGTVLITDFAGIEHSFIGFIKWRTPSGNSPSTVVFQPDAGTSLTLATHPGAAWGLPTFPLDATLYVGLTFNGQSLGFAEFDDVSGNAATSGLLDVLNNYLAAQPQLSVGDLTADEGAGTATFTVQLSSASSDTITVGWDTSDGTAGAGSDYVAASGTLTFLPGQTSRTVSVSVINDGSAESSETFNLVLRDPTLAAISDRTGVATITDNDVVRSLVSGPVSAHTSEAGQSATFGVRLSAQPTANVTVAVTSSQTSEGTVGPATLTFTSTNWNVDQTVTVTGVDDPVDDGSVAYAVQLSATSADSGYQGLSGSVAVVNDDDDTAGLLVGAVSRHTTEAGQTATFTVRLASQPTGTVTVALASTDSGEGTVSVATLTFTAANWSTPQTVTVTGVDDDAVDGDIAYAVQLDSTSSDAGYQGRSTTVAVVNDDDDAATLVTGAISRHTSESGQTATFTVQLGSQPQGPVTVAVASSDGGEGTVSVASLVFTPLNWNQPQTVTVTGVDDDRVDGEAAYGVQLASTSADAAYQGLSTSVAVVNDDDDIAALVVGTPPAHATEAGGSTTFTVRLATRPDAAVTVAVAGSDASEGTLAPALLTFTAADWNVDQAVTATGADDTLVDGAVTWQALLSAQSADPHYHGLTGQAGLVTDDDDSAGLVLSRVSVDTGEDGSADTFTVRLSSQPTDVVQLAVAVGDAGEAGAGPSLLTFTAANWQLPQTVTVTGVDDADVDGDIGYFVTLTASSHDGAYDGSAGAVAGTNHDNDAAALVVAGGPLETAESGGAATFTVRLASRPSAPVVLQFVSSRPGEAQPRLREVTIAPDDWNLPLSITVDGVDDALDDGSAAFTLTVTARSTDGTYDGRSATLQGRNADDDVSALRVDRQQLRTSESGDDDHVSVWLASQPSADVWVSLTALDATEDTVPTASLHFTPENWNQPRQVAVHGVDDPLMDGTVRSVLRLLTQSTDRGYASLALDIAVDNVDDDRAALVFDAADALRTGEDGQGDRFGLRLASAPRADVVVTLTSGDPGEGRAVTTRLLFTPQNWHDVQAVQLAGVDDAWIDGDVTWPLQLATASADPGYDGLRETRPVVNADDDRVTDDIEPSLDLGGGREPLQPGDSARLLDPWGQIVTTTPVTPEQAAARSVQVDLPPLDDGVYTYQVQVFGADGQLRDAYSLTFTVVTDRDGVAPSVEMAVRGGDGNGDGLPDWQQNGVAPLPLRSPADHAAGRDAAPDSFGVVVAGAPTGDGRALPDPDAQLLDLAVEPAPTGLDGFEAAGPVWRLGQASRAGGDGADGDPSRDGHQALFTIDLPFGSDADDLLVWDNAAAAWRPASASAPPGAVQLLDTDGDGRVDRLVLAVTDGGWGDSGDGGAGRVSARVMLARTQAEPVYSVRLADGDRHLATDPAEAARAAQGDGAVFEGAWFDALPAAQGPLEMLPWRQAFTGDLHWAAAGSPMPYACYVQRPDGGSWHVAAADDPTFDVSVHLYLDAQGRTQLMPPDLPATAALLQAGYRDVGAAFRTSDRTAFAFDPEGYLVANRHDEGVQALVHDLAQHHGRTSDPGFIDAVEHHYLAQVALTGLPHGGAADADAVNLAFGTHFGS